MTEPSLPELEAERDRLYAQLSTVGDFRRGSVSENYRKCGKPNCACAAAGHHGHEPPPPVRDQLAQWARGAIGRSAEIRRLAADSLHITLCFLGEQPPSAVEQIAEVSEKICEARPVAGTQASPVPEGERGGFSPRSRKPGPPR